MTDKPIVTFREAYLVYDINGNLRGLLQDVKGHPNLGDEGYVTTSKVLDVTYAEDGSAQEIETLNTFYRRADEDSNVQED